VKIRYLFFNPDDYKSQAQVSEEKINQYYNEHPAEFKTEKTVEATTKPLEEVKDSIREKLIAQEAQRLALDKADSVFNDLFDGDDLSVAAKTYHVAVETTDFFARSNPPKMGIRNMRQFVETAFSLEKMAISEIQDLGNGYYLLQVLDHQEAAIPSLESVADKVKGDVVKSQQRNRASTDAEGMLAGIAKGETWLDLVSKYHLKEMTTDYFKRNGSIPQIGQEPEMVNAAFALTSANPVSTKVIEGRQGYYVIRLKDRKSPSSEGFEKQKSVIMSRLTNQKKQSTLQQWMQDMETRAKIDKNLKMIE
jgi:peptidyl-prolyl cis-trans isomerase D